MEWEYYEELGFVMSHKEDEGAEFVVAEKFLDGVPDDLDFLSFVQSIASIS